MLIVSPAMRLISASPVISTAGDAELQEPTVDLDRQFAGGFRVKTAPSYGAAGCQEGAPPYLDRISPLSLTLYLPSALIIASSLESKAASPGQNGGENVVITETQRRATLSTSGRNGNLACAYC